MRPRTALEWAIVISVTSLSAVFGFKFVMALHSGVITQQFLFAYLALFFVVLIAGLYLSFKGHRAAKRAQALLAELKRRRLLVEAAQALAELKRRRLSLEAEALEGRRK